MTDLPPTEPADLGYMPDLEIEPESFEHDGQPAYDWKDPDHRRAAIVDAMEAQENREHLAPEHGHEYGDVAPLIASEFESDVHEAAARYGLEVDEHDIAGLYLDLLERNDFTTEGVEMAMQREAFEQEADRRSQLAEYEDYLHARISGHGEDGRPVSDSERTNATRELVAYRVEQAGGFEQPARDLDALTSASNGYDHHTGEPLSARKRDEARRELLRHLIQRDE